MSGAIENYRNMVEQPWGRMFYDLIYRQIDIKNDKRLKILDVGAGFCLSADHYAKDHDVTAIEPNKEMYDLRVKDNEYVLITKGTEYLTKIKDDTFDVVICHNVLEYVNDMDEVLRQFVRVLRPNGILSIVKHNEAGRIFTSAVLNDDPKTALDMLNRQNDESSPFGNRNVYDNDHLIKMLSTGMTHKFTYGIRAFYGLSSNNEIKFNDEWYQNMLELETRAGSIDEYKKVAFFHHLIIEKRP